MSHQQRMRPLLLLDLLARLGLHEFSGGFMTYSRISLLLGETARTLELLQWPRPLGRFRFPVAMRRIRCTFI
jgi:hypothetical protein